MGKRTDIAIETLKNGGYFWGSKDFDYYGKPIVKIRLVGSDMKTVKGIGTSTLIELAKQGLIRYVDRPGEYRNVIEMMMELRGLIYGKYEWAQQ